jgi:nicotinamidase/pyrazinamidase
MPESLAFFDVDTQVDFMLPSGSLYVPGAAEIIPNLSKLMAYAQKHRIPVLSSADAHAPDDPSFAQWPPHCVARTPGQRRIPETEFPSAVVIPNRPGAFSVPRVWSGQFIIEKQDYDATTNANFDAILTSLGARRFVVFGVATDYCVRWTVLSLRKRGLSVDVASDAVKAISEKEGRKALKEMAAAGARMVTTAEICVAA